MSTAWNGGTFGSIGGGGSIDSLGGLSAQGRYVGYSGGSLMSSGSHHSHHHQPGMLIERQKRESLSCLWRRWKGQWMLVLDDLNTSHTHSLPRKSNHSPSLERLSWAWYWVSDLLDVILAKEKGRAFDDVTSQVNASQLSNPSIALPTIPTTDAFYSLSPLFFLYLMTGMTTIQMMR